MWEISEWLFLEEDLDCVTGWTEQTAPMCETDDLSHPDQAQMTSVRHIFEKLIMNDALISRRWQNALIPPPEKCKSSFSGAPVLLRWPRFVTKAAVFLREIWSATFQSLPSANKFRHVTHSEREHCDSTGPALVGKRKNKVGVHVPL